MVVPYVYGTKYAYGIEQYHECHKEVKGGGWWGGQGLNLKMEADHDWSQETRLQGCAGSLVADM